MKINDFIDDGALLEGEPVDISELLDNNLIIKDFAELDSTYEGQETYMIVQVDDNGTVKTFSSGGKVLMKQLKKLKEDKKLPIRARIIRPAKKRYYKITAPTKIKK